MTISRSEDPALDILEYSEIDRVVGPGTHLEPLKNRAIKEAEEILLEESVEDKDYMSEEYKQVLRDFLGEENFYSPDGFEEIVEEGYLPGGEIVERVEDAMEKMPDYMVYRVDLDWHEITSETTKYELELTPLEAEAPLTDTIKSIPGLYRSKEERNTKWRIKGEVDTETYEELLGGSNSEIVGDHTSMGPTPDRHIGLIEQADL